ncbi:general substrate transporter [Aspergillus insuetus]
MSSEKTLANSADTVGESRSEKVDIDKSNTLADGNLLNDAVDGENREHQMGVWEAAKRYPWACFWAFIMCFTIEMMESFDMFLNTDFVALEQFSKTYGVQTGPDSWAIPTRWQSALFQAGQCGAFVGVYLAGPITNRFGYRWTTLLGLVLMNVTIFVSFFANSLTLLVIGQALEGVPWGFFIANSPAYASEIVPLPLRAACTATLQMSWSSGSIIVAGATYAYNGLDNQWSWRIPLMVLIFLAPESPEALRSIKRLGAKTEERAQQSLAMIECTVKIEEEQMGGLPTLLDLVKGTDRRRTIITWLVHASQNFAGNLIANQATYFFEQAGIASNKAFQLNLITTSLQLVANTASWFLTSWFWRRTVFLWDTATNVLFLFIFGIIATVPQSHKINYAQACLCVIISFVYAGAQGPISYTIISETSSVRLRVLSTAIPMIYLASRMLNTTGWNLAGKCGYVWGGTATVTWVLAYFFLSELKDRSYREADILFHRKVDARKFKSTVIGVEEDE